MALEQLAADPDFQLLAGPKTGALSKVYCCDLLSMAMSHAPAGGLWVTVMNNLNTLAVAVLCEVSAVVLAEQIVPAPEMLARAEKEGIALLTTPLPVFEAAMQGKKYTEAAE